MISNNNIPKFEYKSEYREEMRVLLEERKKKRFFIFWFSTFAVAISLAAIAYSLGTFDVSKEIEMVQDVGNQSSISSNKVDSVIISGEVDVKAIQSNSFEPTSASKNDIEFSEVKNSSVAKMQKLSSAIVEENSGNNLHQNLLSVAKVISNFEPLETNEEKSKLVNTLNESKAVDSLADSNVVQLPSAMVAEKVDSISLKVAEEKKSVSGDEKFIWRLNLGGGLNNSMGVGEYDSRISYNYTAGFDVIKKINDRSAVGLGLSYSVFQNAYNMGGSDTVVLTGNSFVANGFDKSEVRVVTHNNNNYMTTLNLPVYYHFFTEKFEFDAGLNFQYIMQNKYQQTSDSLKYGINNLVVVTEVLLDKSVMAPSTKVDFYGLNRFHYGFFIASRYRLTSRLSAGVKLQGMFGDYSPNKIWKSNELSSLFSCQANVCYNFR